MISDDQIVIPCCPHCHDWLRPTLLFAYPFDAVVWACVNGCVTLIQGIDDGVVPDPEETLAISSFARRLVRG